MIVILSPNNASQGDIASRREGRSRWRKNNPLGHFAQGGSLCNLGNFYVSFLDSTEVLQTSVECGGSHSLQILFEGASPFFYFSTRSRRRMFLRNILLIAHSDSNVLFSSSVECSEIQMHCRRRKELLCIFTGIFEYYCRRRSGSDEASRLTW